MSEPAVQSSQVLDTIPNNCIIEWKSRMLMAEWEQNGSALLLMDASGDVHHRFTHTNYADAMNTQVDVYAYPRQLAQDWLRNYKPTMSRLQARVNLLRELAARHDGIDPEEIFLTFSPDNPHLADYEDAVQELMAAIKPRR